jgi:hypothetical protein
MKILENEKAVIEPMFANQSEGLETGEERELFHGKLEGLFNNPPVRASAGGKN